VDIRLYFFMIIFEMILRNLLSQLMAMIAFCAPLFIVVVFVYFGFFSVHMYFVDVVASRLLLRIL